MDLKQFISRTELELRSLTYLPQTPLAILL